MPARLSRNNGFDGVWTKYNSDGSIADIIISESKFTSTGKASLTNTKTMGRQLSPEWIDGNIQKMLNSTDPAVVETGLFLDANRSLIRTKANALDAAGTNRWNVINRPQ